MTDPVQITTIVALNRESTAEVTFVLTTRLSDSDDYELGLEAHGSGSVVLRRFGGIVDASSFTSHGGALFQVSESFDARGDTVTLTVGRRIDAEVDELHGFLVINGERSQSDVPVVVS